MTKRKHVVLLLLTSLSIPLTGLLYSNLVQANPTVTGYVSVSAAAFTPYRNQTWYVKDYYGYRGEIYAYAHLQLPHGATLTNMTAHLRDSTSVGYVFVSLRGYNLTANSPLGVGGYMATAQTNMAETPGSTIRYDDTILNATFDNKNCVYCLMFYATEYTPNLILSGVLMEYEYEAGVGVGGFTIPVDKFSLLAPYIISTITIILVASITIAYIKYRKKQ